MQKGPVCVYILRQLQEFNIYYAKSSCVFIFNVNYKNLSYIMQKGSYVFIFNVNYKNLTYIMQKGRVFICNVNYKNLTYIMQKGCVCLYLTSTTRI